jgi:cold-inducible RNA-binding protein
MKPPIDLSVACVRWEPFSKFIRLLRHLERKEMSVKLYVGNLTFNTTEQDIQEQFSRHGQVSSASIITDLDPGRSRAFAFVELDSQESAQAAIDALNGKELDGRALTVKEDRPGKTRTTAAVLGEDAVISVVTVAAAATKGDPLQSPHCGGQKASRFNEEPGSSGETLPACAVL